jgi:hypothetical protein
LFAALEACVEEPLTEKQRQVVAVLEVVRIEEQVAVGRRGVGRPAHDRRPLARAFVAKAVYGEPTTVGFLERLRTERNLRQIRGWHNGQSLPSEATFSLLRLVT